MNTGCRLLALCGENYMSMKRYVITTDTGMDISSCLYRVPKPQCMQTSGVIFKFQLLYIHRLLRATMSQHVCLHLKRILCVAHTFLQLYTHKW